ncbi:putative toxin-antitoxin system toxin component, PIN family [Candidatus Woesearchaeota archaeon]|nr:putative toxin-antitoxin system toxin component, PIN family [Candidatus Woesearchaeota archaeon]
MGKKKIVIDTNNYIAALGWKGKSRELLERVIDGEYELYLSVKQLQEIKRVIEYPKFTFSLDQKKRFLKLLEEFTRLIDTRLKLNVVKDDPDDNIIIECAIEANVDYIISGDVHLKKLAHYKHIPIIPVSEFLRM